MKDRGQDAKRAVKIIKQATKQAYAVVVLTRAGTKVMTITGYWSYTPTSSAFHGALQIFPITSAIQQVAVEEGYPEGSVVASSSIMGGSKFVEYNKIERTITTMLGSMRNIITKGLGVHLSENKEASWEQDFINAGYYVVRVL